MTPTDDTVPASAEGRAPSVVVSEASVPRARWAVPAMAVAAFVGQTSSLLPSGMLTQISTDLRVSLAAAGALTSAFALAMVATVVPLTRWTARMSGRDIVGATLGVQVVGNLVVALSPALATALLGRFLVGAAHGLLWAALPVVVIRLTSPLRRARAMAAVYAGSSAGLALGAPLSTLLGGAIGWRPAFVVVATAGLLAALLAVRVVPSIKAPAAESLPLLAAVRQRGVVLLSTSWAITLVGHYAVLTYISPYLHRLGVGTAMVGVALSVLGVAGIAGVTLAGRVPRRSHLAGTIATVAVMLVAFVLLLVLPARVPIVMVVLGLWGAGLSANLLFSQQAVILVGYRAPETASSVSILITQLGVAAGASVGGLIADTSGVRWVPLAGAVFAALAILVATGGRSAFRQALDEQSVGARRG